MRRRQIIAALVILTAVLVAVWWFRWRPLAFDSVVWKSVAGDYKSSTRYRMRESALVLLAQGVVKTQGDALQYFGPSDTGTNLVRWSYRLGPQYMIDHWWLDLRFDDQGTIIQYHIRPD